MSLYKYSYSNSRNYLKNPTDHWKMMNFKGQVYEASFVEYIVINICKFSEIGLNVVAKGPYASKNSSKHITTGFYCDSKGSILYNSNKISLAEFDCIVIGESEVFIYECTLSNTPTSVSKLRTEGYRKITLLEKLFPHKKVTCIVVSNELNMITEFKNMDGFDGLLYTMPLVDLPNLAKESKLGKIANNNKMTSTVSLNNDMVIFDYIQEFNAINLLLLRYSSFASIRERLLSYNGLFPRFYWGKLPAIYLGEDFTKVRSDYVIVAINFSNINSPVIRYYFLENKSNKVYECSKPDKALNKMKSSRAEIIKINDKIPEKTIAELEILKREILE